jgi:hypothetical protein
MLTQTQVEKLKQAVANAQGQGQCAYVIDGKPGCVIGQLAVLEGVSAESLQQWPSSKIWALLKLDGGESAPQCSVLKEYPATLLQGLQDEWDDKFFERSEEQVREAMLERIQDFQRVSESTSADLQA